MTRSEPTKNKTLRQDYAKDMQDYVKDREDYVKKLERKNELRTNTPNTPETSAIKNSSKSSNFNDNSIMQSVLNNDVNYKQPPTPRLELNCRS